MTNRRKTRDEWQLHINYGQGWEHEISEDTWPEMRQRLREYRENVPQYPVKAIKRRIRLSSYEIAQSTLREAIRIEREGR
jgi:hypothetical protein